MNHSEFDYFDYLKEMWCKYKLGRSKWRKYMAYLGYALKMFLIEKVEKFVTMVLLIPN